MSEAQTNMVLPRTLAIEVARVTEAAAIAAAKLRGRGDERSADSVAVDAMRRELNKLPMRGLSTPGAALPMTR